MTDAERQRKLAELLSRFDEEDKDELGQKLAESLELTPGAGFARQVAALLKRDLRAGERFRLDVLERAALYHGDSEEEEEEEE